MKCLIQRIFLLMMLVSTAIEAEDTHNPSLHIDWLDNKINSCEDFYAYANGNWQKNNPIPAHYASWGTFSILQEKVQKLIHQMLIDAAEDKKAKPGSIEQKVGDFYFSGMDEASINQLGIAPLRPDFLSIDAIKDIKGLQAEIASLQQVGVDVCFNFGSMQDFKNSEEMIGAAEQGGLGLPDRDYYLNNDVKFKNVRNAYLNYIANMFQLLGDSQAQSSAEARVVMRIETALAEASLSQIEQRDPHAIYHLMTLKELNEATPNFSWPAYFKAMGYPTINHINLAMPNFFKKLDELYQTIPLSDWKIYLRWHLVDRFSPYLSQAFVKQHFMMVSALTGTKKILPRWQRVVNTENSVLGFAVGKLYVEKYFSSQSKQAVLLILENIRKVLRDDLHTLAWMTASTREAALKKLDLMQERVGYPTQWIDYSGLKIDRGPYVLNIKRAYAFLNKRELDKIGKPIDKSEWAMTPQTVNAYYDPSMNNINIPAGILQPPFFDPSAPAAINYGAIGFVMGHEITHGFDDEGSQFDAHGNLKNWWTPEDLKKFQAATNCITQQFSQYKVNGEFSVQGKLVTGEATADLGGLMLAYRAFHQSPAYQSAKKIDGFTPDQQFFLSAAHVWATNMRPEQLRNLVTIDPHPPAQYRVNGTLANFPPFQASFGLNGHCPLVNKNPCKIW